MLEAQRHAKEVHAPPVTFKTQNIDWTEDLTAQLVSLLLPPSKLSASQIADHFGVSRNAVIGKVSRLGLNLPNKGNHNRHNSPIRRKRHAPWAVPHIDLIVKPQEPKHKTLFELGDKDCRWPFGEGPYTFCGHKTMTGSSYCAGHFAKSIPKAA